MEELARNESRLLPLQLSQSDHDALRGVVKGLRDRLTGFQQSRVSIASSLTLSPQARETALQGVRADEDAVMKSMTALIPTQLTPDGMAKLQSYINEYVKPHIKIYTGK